MNLEELKMYKTIIKAIKIAEYNTELEQDLRDLDINKQIMRKNLLLDQNIKRKALEKINYERN